MDIERIVGPTGKILEVDVVDLPDLEQVKTATYDAFRSMSRLALQPKERLPMVLECIRRVLRPAAVGHVEFALGEGKELWQKEKLLAVLSDAGWQQLECAATEGRIVVWVMNPKEEGQ